MTPAAEARRKLASAPADLRFAALFAPRASRPRLTALFALYVEIREIPHECSDLGVARAKLDWWREEIARLAAQQARHPLTIELAACLPPAYSPAAALSGFIASTEIDIAAPAFQVFEDVEQYCQACGGALTQLAAQCAGAQHATTLQRARNLGIAWQLAEIVLRTGVTAAHGRVYFPAQDLHRFAVDRHVIDGTHSDAGLKALLRDYAQRAHAYAAAPMDGAGLEHASLASARILSSLALLRLKKFADCGYDTARPPVELPPLARLLSAWRAARAPSIG